MKRLSPEQCHDDGRRGKHNDRPPQRQRPHARRPAADDTALISGLVFLSVSFESSKRHLESYVDEVRYALGPEHLYHREENDAEDQPLPHGPAPRQETL